MAIHALPITAVETTTGGPPIISRIIEEASQTFVAGTPVELASGDGGIQAWDGTTLTIISGISTEDAHNLSSTGLGWNGGLAPYTGLGANLTFGSVPNESSAVNIPRGAPPIDGRMGLYVPTGEVIFRGMIGNNGAAYTPTNANVGISYGLTIDSSSKYWYVDVNKTGSSAVVQIVSLDPIDGSIANARVLFKFLAAAIVPVIT
jgi:hypothetical protein